MAFTFKRKEPIRKALPRLARERIDQALDSLKDHRRPQAVHRVRKDIKKARAVLRLARTSISAKSFRRQTYCLRQAADILSPTRDAYVKGTALRHLAGQFQGQLPYGTLTDLGQILDVNLRRETARFDNIGPGLKSAYRRGRNAYRDALQEPSPEHLHQWRKRAKDLWYQLRLLQTVRAEQIAPIADQLRTLTDYLGDDHDLFLLKTTLQRSGHYTEDFPEFAKLLPLIHHRQSQLRLAAFQLGALLYAEKPAIFCRRVAEYWREWRHHKTSSG
jgi:CHAD domain-containing protein